VSAIGNGSQHPVFLAVNELMQATAITCDVICHFTPLLGAFSTTSPASMLWSPHLTQDVVDNITASSGRPMCWVPLLPMLYKHSIEVVAKHGLQFLVNKGMMGHPEFVEQSLEFKECHSVQAVIADCNGHPCSLETALDILQTYTV